MTNFPAHCSVKVCSQRPEHTWIGNAAFCPLCMSATEVRITPGSPATGEGKSKKPRRKKKGNYTPWRESLIEERR